MLGRLYDYSPNEIRELTPAQQMGMLQTDDNDSDVKSKYFSTYEEYLSHRKGK